MNETRISKIKECDWKILITACEILEQKTTKFFERCENILWDIEGAYHLAKKSGNFGLRSNGKAIFRKIFSEIVDNLQRYSSFFRSERNSQSTLNICENPSVSRPFLTRSSKICGMECRVVNGKRHSHPVGH